MFGKYKRAPLCLGLFAVAMVFVFIFADTLKNGENPLSAIAPFLSAISFMTLAIIIFHSANIKK